MSLSKTAQRLVELAPDLREYVIDLLPSTVRNEIEPQDVLQAVMSKVLAQERAGEDHSDLTLRGLQNMAQSILADMLRDRQEKSASKLQSQVANELRSSYLKILEEVKGRERTPSSEAATWEAANAIHLAIREMPEDQAEAVRLRYIEGKTDAEIAARMAQTQESIRGLIGRGLDKISEDVGTPRNYFYDSGSSDIEE